jgi:excisionase family DNA binding protein
MQNELFNQEKTNVLKWEDAPDFLKPQEAAKLMRIGRNRIYEYAAMRDFPKLFIGERNFVIPKESLRQWIDNRISSNQ